MHTKIANSRLIDSNESKKLDKKLIKISILYKQECIGYPIQNKRNLEIENNKNCKTVHK